MDGDLQRAAAHLRGKGVLVTGALGFVGSHLVRRLADAGGRLRLVHRPSTPVTPSTGADVIPGDLRDPTLWERALPGADVVFHLAAQTSFAAAEREPLEDYRVNAESMWHLLDTCRRRGLHPLIVFAGTETQGGAPPRLPVDGTEPDLPISVYDLHKLIAEQLLEFEARRGLVQATTLRLTSVYGPGPRERSADCGILNRMIRTALAGEPLTIYGAGDRLRDYAHVDDVARAFLLAAGGMERCNGRHFVVGSGEQRSVGEAVRLVAATVEQETGIRVPVVHVEPPEDEPEIAKASFAVDPSAFRAATGWQARWSFADGILETVRDVHRRQRAAEAHVSEAHVSEAHVSEAHVSEAHVSETKE